MFDYRQYKRGYFMPPVECNDWVKKEYIDQAPVWCSVDLRDGNQALVEPMSLDEKLEFFNKLIEVGFKEIEIGFPAASETEYELCRTLIEKNMIPDDVTIQVLTQARPHIIKKTFEAVKGAPRAIVHVYNSTSLAQREQVFRKSKDEVKQIAIEGARLLKELAEADGGNFLFEYSLAFCCISTGVFHFPQNKAAEIAVQTVQDYLKEDDRIERVVFNVFKEEDYSIYRRLLGYR